MNSEPSPTTLDGKSRGLSNNNIAPGALRTIERLEQAGFMGYLVGGGVRDLLIGGRPKDFDVATDATPEQVKHLFQRQARIVGRRFRIVHVRHGREITEVTTFRAQHDDKAGSSQAQRSNNGMLLRDNVYGDIQSDALRRDFTMNALYYSPSQGEITDFTNGVAAINNRNVKIIGDPAIRYREDPVRMLRAVRLGAKLKFEIEPATAAPIFELGKLLTDVAPARLFDECLKLFMAGHAAHTFEQLQSYHLFEHLFPTSAGSLEVGNASPTESPSHRSATQFQSLLYQAMVNTDQRIKQNMRVTPAFIFAVILWPAVVAEEKRLLAQGFKPAPALNAATQSVILQQVKRVAIPRRFTMAMREIWELQLRLPRRGGNQAWRLLEHPRLRAAYDFLLLREQSGEDHNGLGQWWTDFQAADNEQRQNLLKPFQTHKTARKRTARKRQSNNPPNSDDQQID